MGSWFIILRIGPALDLTLCSVFVQFSYFTAVGLPLCVSGQTLLASFKKLFAPFVVQAPTDPSCRHSSAMDISPRNPSITIRILSSALYFFRVFLRICRTVDSAFSFFLAMWVLLILLTRLRLKSLHYFFTDSIQWGLTPNSHVFCSFAT